MGGDRRREVGIVMTGLEIGLLAGAIALSTALAKIIERVAAEVLSSWPVIRGTPR